MFACIFFHEDVSLSVVNQNDKKMELLGAFEPKEKVHMMWRKKTYNGTIIKVAENEEELDKFAAKANKAVLEGKTSKDEINYEVTIENLLNFEITKKSSGKRQRVPTEKIKASQEQDEKLSPKKKKREPSTGKTELDQGKEQGEKKNSKAVDKKEKPGQISKKYCQERTSLETGKLMFDVLRQFKDDDLLVEQTPDKSTEIATNSTASAFDNQGRVGSSKKDKVEEKTCLFVDPETPKINDKQQENMSLTCSPTATTKPHDNEPGSLKRSIEVGHDKLEEDGTLPKINGNKMQIKTGDGSKSTSLSESWGLCREAISTLEGCPLRPGPSAEILKTLQAICNPEFVKFISHLVEHMKNDSCSHPCLQGTTMYHEHRNDNHHENSFLMDLTGNSSFNNTYNNTSLMGQLTSTPYKVTYQQESTSQQEPSYPSFSEMNTVPKPIGMVEQDESKCQQAETSSYAPESESAVHHFSSSACKQLRRSPRKHRPREESPTDMVKLLKTGDLMVDRNKLRKATSKARNKPGKEGYFLTYRLTEIIFTTEELANSRGLGIGKAKLGEDRPPLDSGKVKDLKDYVTSWCNMNKVKIPSEAEMNSAITEKIGYARKKQKKTV